MHQTVRMFKIEAEIIRLELGGKVSKKFIADFLNGKDLQKEYKQEEDEFKKVWMKPEQIKEYQKRCQNAVLSEARYTKACKQYGADQADLNRKRINSSVLSDAALNYINEWVEADPDLFLWLEEDPRELSSCDATCLPKVRKKSEVKAIVGYAKNLRDYVIRTLKDELDASNQADEGSMDANIPFDKKEDCDFVNREIRSFNCSL